MAAIIITESDVYMSIKRLKNKFTRGPDGLPPILSKQCIRSLTMPLAFIFNQLMSVNAVFETWKTALTTPVFKKMLRGPCVQLQTDLINVCIPSEILERIISNKIIDHLNVNNILQPAQHVFARADVH